MNFKLYKKKDIQNTIHMLTEIKFWLFFMGIKIKSHLTSKHLKNKRF